VTKSRERIRFPVLGIFVLVSLLSLILIGLAGFIKSFARPPLIYVVLGLPAAALIAFFIIRLIRWPRRDQDWGVRDAGIKKKLALRWQGLLSYVGGGLALLGLAVILTGAGWGEIFRKKQTLTLTEGETRQLSSNLGDSLHLYKFCPTFYPQSRSVNDYKALIITLVDSVFTWDTVSLNSPLRIGNRRIYLTDHGMSKDSLYLLFRLVLPWDDTIAYEFPPQGVIDDPRFPLIVSFEKFYIDRTQLWPEPEVPEVSIKLMLPGELLLSERLRAPDSVNFEDYTLFFDGIRMRPTVTFICLKDKSWIIAAAGGALLIIGLILGLISQAAIGVGREDV
jgi:hypothetical protein